MLARLAIYAPGRAPVETVVDGTGAGSQGAGRGVFWRWPGGLQRYAGVTNAGGAVSSLSTTLLRGFLSTRTIAKRNRCSICRAVWVFP